MKYLVSLLFILSLFHNASAGNLCDESCGLTITFPNGGSIEAVEPLTFTFGEAGVINDGMVVTGYSAGDTLSLAAGESMAFQSGGFLDSGVEGNLEYTNISITDSSVEIVAIGGAEMIFIYQMTLAGGGQFNFNSNVTVVESGVLSLLDVNTDVVFNLSDGTVFNNYGVLNISGNLTVSGQGTLWNDTVNWSDPDDCNMATSDSTITVTGGSVAVLSNISCGGDITLSNSVILSPSGGGNIEFPPNTLTNVGVIELIGASPVIILADLTELAEPISLTQEDLSVFPDGFVMETNDGNTCAITAGNCVSATGAEYIVEDGKLVLAATGDSGGSSSNGMMGWFLNLIVFSLVFFRKRAAV